MFNRIVTRLQEDIDAVFQRDPAVRSRVEVVLCYPGFHALLFYRIAHRVWLRGLPVLARFISHIGRGLTGIEIHPGARIGRRFFIDHGMGVVIGETAEIGDNVTLYHDVTLGGTTWQKGKRHPTVEDGVIIGAGAAVLGPITIGANARIGSNAVVVGDVPAGATMVGMKARQVSKHYGAEEQAFTPYGAASQDLPDPVSRAIDGLLSHIAQLEARIAALESRTSGGADDSGDEHGIGAEEAVPGRSCSSNGGPH